MAVDAAQRWLRQTCPGLRPATRDALRWAVGRWCSQWAGLTLQDLDGHLLSAYLSRYRETHAASTSNLERRLLRWFTAWCRREGLVGEDPTDRIPPFTAHPRAPRAITLEEEDRLLQTRDGFVYAAIVLAIETGLRRASLLKLEWAHVDLEAGWLHLPGTAMKSGVNFDVPLSERAHTVLRQYCTTRVGRVFPWSGTTLQRHFRRAARSANLEIHFHDLRRTFFTRARRRGIDLEVAMRLSDHRDVRTALAHYRAISPEELLLAVGRTQKKIGAVGN